MTLDFDALARTPRGFQKRERIWVGHVPTLAITPVADGRTGAYEANQAATWRLVERVHRLLAGQVVLADGIRPRIVVAPEIVYGARTAALAQAHYAREGVSANIWVSRSWAYSDELMGACMGIGSTEWQQCAYGLNGTDRPGAVWLKAFTAAIRNRIFIFLRGLVVADYETAIAHLDSPLDGDGANWTPDRLDKIMAAYEAGHERLCLDPNARNARHTYVTPSEDKKLWRVQQMLVDPKEDNDWVAEFVVDLVESRKRSAATLRLLRIGQLA